jgi:hypothetical protein
VHTHICTCLPRLAPLYITTDSPTLTHAFAQLDCRMLNVWRFCTLFNPVPSAPSCCWKPRSCRCKFWHSLHRHFARMGSNRQEAVAPGMAGLERELLVRPAATLLALGDGHCWRLSCSFRAPLACPQRGCHRSVALLHMCALSLFSLLSSRLQQHPSLLQLSIRHAQQASQLQLPAGAMEALRPVCSPPSSYSSARCPEEPSPAK